MKKMFFLMCMVVLMPAFAYAETQTMSASNQTVLREFSDKYIKTGKLGRQSVLFYHKHSRRIADPIITFETLKNVESIAARPIFFVNAYPNFTLLILTTILLLLTIARRKQLEHATDTVHNLAYCNAVR